MYRSLVASLLMLAATGAAAQDGPSFDCARAGTSAEELICSDPDLAALDRRIAARFAEALTAARGLDAGASDAEVMLRATQRGWLKGRDACWKAGDGDIRGCIADAYLLREAELVTRWMLEPPTATAFWTCDGNPANEVVTMFFDTELPSLRFERGDSVDTGTRLRTGSGARYAGSFGREIWIKGDEARYRDPDPGGTGHDCTLSRQE